jgi:hypothetical protein
MRTRFLGLVTLLAVGVMTLATASAFAQGGSIGNYDPLTLACLGNPGTNFVEIGVKAGPSGAPAGFTLQWMSYEAWVANGGAWYASDDPRLCKMSFSGQPSFSGNTTTRWELNAYGEVDLRIGDLLYDETGVSGALSNNGTGGFTNPDCQLACGTEYVFRAFAHASRYMGRSCYSFIGTASAPEVGSPFSCSVSTTGPEVVEPGLTCATASGCNTGCTFTFGYWMTHGSGDCHNGNNADAWCVDHLTLGTHDYTKDELCAILNQEPAKGNGLVALAHQLIAAKLNATCNGATCANGAIADADALIGDKVIPPVGTASLKPSVTSPLVGQLDDFNNGLGCAEHCTRPQLGPNGAQPVKRARWGEIKVRYR